jgi:hypothetical protein
MLSNQTVASQSAASSPQSKGLGIKPAVRKDLVIWSASGMTTWDNEYRACNAPIVIVEWKARKQELSDRDPELVSGVHQAFSELLRRCCNCRFFGVRSRIHAAAVRAGVVDRN